MEKRMQDHLRKLIDSYVEKGWSIVERDPFILHRNGHAMALTDEVLREWLISISKNWKINWPHKFIA